jgi:hypothetical protein
MDNLNTKPLALTQRPPVRALYYGRRMARIVQNVSLSHPEIADQIRAEMEEIQNSHHRIRMLLARYRLKVRSVPVLPFRQRV